MLNEIKFLEYIKDWLFKLILKNNVYSLVANFNISHLNNKEHLVFLWHINRFIETSQENGYLRPVKIFWKTKFRYKHSKRKGQMDLSGLENWV